MLEEFKKKKKQQNTRITREMLSRRQPGRRRGRFPGGWVYNEQMQSECWIVLKDLDEGNIYISEEIE